MVTQTKSKVLNLRKTYKLVIWKSIQLNLIEFKFNHKRKIGRRYETREIYTLYSHGH